MFSLFASSQKGRNCSSYRLDISLILKLGLVSRVFLCLYPLKTDSIVIQENNLSHAYSVVCHFLEICLILLPVAFRLVNLAFACSLALFFFLLFNLNKIWFFVNLIYCLNFKADDSRRSSFLGIYLFTFVKSV